VSVWNIPCQPYILGYRSCATFVLKCLCMGCKVCLMASFVVALSVLEVVSRPIPKVFATLFLNTLLVLGLVLVKAETFTVNDS